MDFEGRILKGSIGNMMVETKDGIGFSTRFFYSATAAAGNIFHGGAL